MLCASSPNHTPGIAASAYLLHVYLLIDCSAMLRTAAQPCSQFPKTPQYAHRCVLDSIS